MSFALLTIRETEEPPVRRKQFVPVFNALSDELPTVKIPVFLSSAFTTTLTPSGTGEAVTLTGVPDVVTVICGDVKVSRFNMRLTFLLINT